MERREGRSRFANWEESSDKANTTASEEVDADFG